MKPSFKICGLRFHLQEVCARDWFCILPRMKKSMALFHIKNFSCHVTLATVKKKTSTCGLQVGHTWVTSGLFCGSVNQTGQQVRPTFNPVLDLQTHYCELWYTLCNVYQVVNSNDNQLGKYNNHISDIVCIFINHDNVASSADPLPDTEKLTWSPNTPLMLTTAAYSISLLQLLHTHVHAYTHKRWWSFN